MLHGCGWASPDGHVVGGCLHGLFAAASAHAAILSTFDITPRISDDDTVVDAALDEIAVELAEAFNITALGRRVRVESDV